MNRLLYITFIIALAAALAGCGHSDTYRVHGNLDDGSDINLRFVYYVDGKVLTGVTASNKGKFAFEGSAPVLSVVEIYDNDYRPLGRFLARNGEDFDITLSRKDRYAIRAEGNAETALWVSFLNKNAEALRSSDPAVRNAAVARFVADNPDSPVSLYVLATEYDASGPYAAGADSLLALINTDLRRTPPADGLAYMLARAGAGASAARLDSVPYRARGNRMATFAASRHTLSLLAFSQGSDGRDSILAALRRIDRRGKAEVYDLSMDPDTLTWHRNTRTDSASWTQGWLAGGISARAVDSVGIPSLPFYILVDSAGRQLLRTPDLKLAEDKISKQ